MKYRALHLCVFFLVACVKPVARPECEAVAMYDEQFTRLSVPALEERVLSSRVLPPSAASVQLANLKAASENIVATQRECQYRASLIATLASFTAASKTMPEFFGQTREVGELKMLYLEMPFEQKTPVEMRKAQLQKIEELFVAAVSKNNRQDAEHYRRMYLGIALACQMTPEARKQLAAQKPTSCFEL
jgi:hypothetical protein